MATDRKLVRGATVAELDGRQEGTRDPNTGETQLRPSLSKRAASNKFQLPVPTGPSPSIWREDNVTTDPSPLYPQGCLTLDNKHFLSSMHYLKVLLKDQIILSFKSDRSKYFSSTGQLCCSQERTNYL